MENRDLNIANIYYQIMNMNPDTRISITWWNIIIPQETIIKVLHKLWLWDKIYLSIYNDNVCLVSTISYLTSDIDVILIKDITLCKDWRSFAQKIALAFSSYMTIHNALN